MKYNELGRSGIKVSEICLGTMTWGSQNSEAEAHEQMDYALEQGVNFWDTAEVYPTTPVSPETQGRTEEYIGTWFQKSGKRDQVVLATKIAGKGRGHIRNGAAISSANIEEAVDGSLKRLQTDHIDLYQLHWPNRGRYAFRGNWGYDASTQDTEKETADLLDILQALDKQVKAGKIRTIGVSNDTAWGVMKMLELAKEHDLPMVQSIQNEYNLIDRKFDTDLAEVAHHTKVGLLAYSPLAAGILTGKYQDGAFPQGSRGALDNALGGRNAFDYWREPTKQYLDIAKKHDLLPEHLAIAFCLSRYFMTSAIIGATTMDQLKKAISSADVTLSQDVLDEIEAVHRKYPLPF